MLYTRLHGQAPCSRSCAFVCASPASATDPLPLRGSCLLHPARQRPSTAQDRPGSAAQRPGAPDTLRRLTPRQLRSRLAHGAPARIQRQARHHLPCPLRGPSAPHNMSLLRTEHHNRHATVSTTNGARELHCCRSSVRQQDSPQSTFLFHHYHARCKAEEVRGSMVGRVHLAARGSTSAVLLCRAGRCGQLRRLLKGLCCALCGLAAHAHSVRCVCLQRRPHK